MSKIVLDEKEVNELMDTFDFKKSVYLQELKKINSLISQINELHLGQQAIATKIMINYGSIVDLGKRLEKINETGKILSRIELNSKEILENHINTIKNDDFFEPLRLKIETEQFFFNSLLTENKQLIKTKIDEINQKIAEYLNKIQEQVKEIQIAKDVIDIRYQNYTEKLGIYGEIFLENFQKMEEKIEVNRDKNLKLVLYITAGISITTLIACGAILFKLFKLFH
ncbi:hypothetical protein [Aliarcobacter butzleri]|uniref:Uncharacterized protein n=1 Tax=Aliarcobacter butzleri L352 TaxID=1447260 RepID=A0A837JDZ9_9BACT|nr:hypothetical protein [Aliarcobacter butzleri]KLE06031.1 hypothetical protein AF77_03055 [Aliarcobacter butzleri L352]MCG3687721.1 hypothetical protein [Aliarcobacter butzleri]BAK70967.1 conserved hypothetical protein [Aliarcobacter butzleri ED-1]